ncbi:hypothetical protein CDL15_Pgr023406 [Punica granatum]|uniref:Uncharacterized protein n=1 Tax=Punica granatum TaxID=22663 RepID=A0A218Y1C1_PUNGR|nr:hypothetical protein CDL15_Pgr023406 [Punica granatum]
MASFAAARSVLRSSSAFNFAARLASEAQAARSPIRAASRRRPSLSTFRRASKSSLLIESRRDELLRRVDDAVPHRDRFGIDDLNARHFSAELWLASRSIVINLKMLEVMIFEYVY